jgi:hypothetical protein
MADINVQRKGPAIWPWILGLILLALIIWLLASQWGRDDRAAVVDDRPVAEEPAPAAAEPAALQQFAQRCVEASAQQQAVLEHQFTVECLRQLADAIEATAQQQGLQLSAVQPQTQDMRQNAQQIEQLPDESLEHSNHARLGAMAGVAALQTLNQAPGTPDATAQVNQAEQSAQAIQPRGLMTEQKDNIDRYFQQAYEALRNVSGHGGTRANI